MKNRIHLLSLVILLCGCGIKLHSTDTELKVSSTSTSSVPDAKITAKVQAGAVSDSLCNLYELDSDGNTGEVVLAFDRTNDEGIVNIDVGKITYSGSAIIKCSGGSYIDEATLETVARSDDYITKVILKQVTSGGVEESYPVTMHTTIATDLVSSFLQDDIDLDEAIDASNEMTAEVFGLDSILVIPEELTTSKEDAESPGSLLAQSLASVCSLAKELDVTCDDYMKSIVSDVGSDGEADGMAGDEAVAEIKSRKTGKAVELPKGSEWSGRIKTAHKNWLEDTTIAKGPGLKKLAKLPNLIINEAPTNKFKTLTGYRAQRDKHSGEYKAIFDPRHKWYVVYADRFHKSYVEEDDPCILERANYNVLFNACLFFDGTKTVKQRDNFIKFFKKNYMPVPDAPTDVALLDPSKSKGFNLYPKVLVTGEFLAKSKVKLYTDSNCRGDSIGESEENSEKATSMTVTPTTPLSRNGIEFKIYATILNAFGTPSDCSSVSAKYEYEVPQIESISYSSSQVSGASTITKPSFKITNEKDIEVGEIAYLYSDSLCQNEVGSFEVTDASSDLVVTLTDELAEKSYSLFGKYKDSYGNYGNCSSKYYDETGTSGSKSVSIDYTVDSSAPQPSSVKLVSALTTPASNVQKDFKVRVEGQLEIDMDVKLYLDQACAGDVYGENNTGTSNNPNSTTINSIDVTVNKEIPELSNNKIYAKFYDSLENAGSCSVAYEDYAVDITSPTPGSFGLVSTDSTPSNKEAPSLKFINGIENNLKVTVYKDLCDSTSLGSATYSGSSGILNVPIDLTSLSDGEHKLVVKYEDENTNSKCSSDSDLNISFDYTLDRTPPVATALALKTGQGPIDNNLTPELHVTLSESLSSTDTIYIYDNDSCSGGTEIVSKERADLTTLADTDEKQFYIPLSLTENKPYTFYIRLKDALNNITAGCQGGISATYVLDTLAPIISDLTRNVPSTNPSNSLTPSFKVFGGESETVTATLYLSNDSESVDNNTKCDTIASNPDAGSASDGVVLTIDPPYVSDGAGTDDGTYIFYAKFEDAYGNTTCSGDYSTNPKSITYKLDTISPVLYAMGMSEPATLRANDTTPEIKVTGSFSESMELYVYSDNGCTNQIGYKDLSSYTASETKTAETLTLSGLTENANNTFYVKYVDSLGNVSLTCTEGETYYLDTLAPLPTAITYAGQDTNTDNVTNPTVQVTGNQVNGDIVKVYSDSSCSSTKELGRSTADLNASSGNTTAGKTDVYISGTLDEGLNELYVTIEDQYSNVSTCSGLMGSPFKLGYTLKTQMVQLSSVSLEDSSGNEIISFGTEISGTDNEENLKFVVFASTPQNKITIEVYDDEDCDGNLQATTGQFDMVSSKEISISLGEVDKAYNFYFKMRDEFGNNSCSGQYSSNPISVTYNLDNQVPTVSSLSASSALSKDATVDITVNINNELSANTVGITLYTDNESDSATKCDNSIGSSSGVAVSQYSASDTITSTTITTDPLLEGSYSIYVGVVDSYGNSYCHSTSEPYQRDVTPPVISAITLISPVAGSSFAYKDEDPEFKLTGVTEEGMIISLFKDVSCSSKIASGKSDSTNASNDYILIRVGEKYSTGDTDNTTLDQGENPIYVKVLDKLGNTGSCLYGSSLLKYDLDSVPPNDLIGLSISGSITPSSNNTPTLIASHWSDTNYTVKLYTGSCGGTEIASKTVAALNLLTSITLDAGKLSDLTPVSIHARMFDSSGNPSNNCASKDYEYRKVVALTSLEMASGIVTEGLTEEGNNKTPKFDLEGVLQGNKLTLHNTTDCSDTAISLVTTESDGKTVIVEEGGTDGWQNLSLTSGSELADGIYTFYVKTTGLEDTPTSTCDGPINYKLDTAAPNPASDSLALVSPATVTNNDLSPELTVTTNLEEDVTVSAYLAKNSDETCSGTALGPVDYSSSTGLTNVPITFDLTVSTTNTIFISYTDKYGNESKCGEGPSLTYTTVPVQEPTFIFRKSPATVQWSDEADVTLRVGVTSSATGVNSSDKVYLYGNSDCSSTSYNANNGKLTSSASDGTYAVDIILESIDEDDHKFYAQAENTDGEKSACSSVYAEYSYDITAPIVTDLDLSYVNPVDDDGTLDGIYTNAFPTPTVKISKGISIGDTVELFSDDQCAGTSLGSGTATENDSIEITTSGMTVGQANNFYAIITDRTGNNTSSCSELLGTYTVSDFSSEVPEGDRICAGSNHSCIIVNNADGVDELKCWGLNDWGQLGRGHGWQMGHTVGSVPSAMTPIDLGTGKIPKSVACGVIHTCVLLTTGEVKCFGRKGLGRLGVGLMQHIYALDGVSQTGKHMTIYGESGDVISMHKNSATCEDNAQLIRERGSDGTYGDAETSLEIPVSSNKIDFLLNKATGDMWVNKKRDEVNECTYFGNVWVKMWPIEIGERLYQMGDSLRSINFGSGRLAKKIAIASTGGCAILDNDSIKCWGLGGYTGQDIPGAINAYTDDELAGMDSIILGDADGDGKSDYKALDMDVGQAHACAIVEKINDSSIKGLMCWGSAIEGQTGYSNQVTIGKGVEGGDDMESLKLVDFGDTGGVDGPVGDPYIPDKVSVAQKATCVLFTNKKIKCWGQGDLSTLGYYNNADHGEEGHHMGNNLNVVDIEGNALDVVLGGSSACALREDDNLWYCWGHNNTGQLGIGERGTVQNTGGTLKPIKFADDKAPSQFSISPLTTEIKGPSLLVASSGDNTADPYVPVSPYIPGKTVDVFTDDDTCGASNKIGDTGIVGSLGNINIHLSEVIADADIYYTIDSGDCISYGAVEPSDVYKSFQTKGFAGHACAYFGSGDFSCWGYNWYGQLGKGTSNSVEPAAGDEGGEITIPINNAQSVE